MRIVKSTRSSSNSSPCRSSPSITQSVLPSRRKPEQTRDNPPSKKRERTYSVEEGYNSEDEYYHKHDLQQMRENEQKLFKFLQDRGLKIVPMKEDGNCMFRAIAHQIYGDAEMHDQIRKLCMDYMEAERDYYSQYVVEEFEEYLTRKRMNHCFGNNLELQAVAELFNRPVEVYSHGEEPLNIFHGEFTSDAPIRVSYHNNNHYNSVIDPNRSTFGVGLGMPALEPGLADKMQVEKAIEESEREFIDNSIAEAEQLGVITQTQDENLEIEKELERIAMRESEKEYWENIAKQAVQSFDFSSLFSKSE